MKEEVKNLVVIGASAGGISAVERLAATFTPDIDAAILVVIHMSRVSKPEVIVNYIQKSTRLECRIAEDGMRLENGKIYFSPCDQHMIVERGKINIKMGAKENHYRPSIDVLFRTAAVAYTCHVIGIILTGLLDDGTSGMIAIKRNEGICIVQAPEEAEFSDMPMNVLRHVDVDYSVFIDEINFILLDIFSKERSEPILSAEEVRLEAQIAMRMSSSVDDIYRLGTLSPLTCPDCGGTLAEITDGNLKRYRCYTGHAFTRSVLADQQVRRTEEYLWSAIRILEERKSLLRTSADDDLQIAQLGLHIERLKKMMIEIGKLETT